MEARVILRDESRRAERLDTRADGCMSPRMGKNDFYQNPEPPRKRPATSLRDAAGNVIAGESGLKQSVNNNRESLTPEADWRKMFPSPSSSVLGGSSTTATPKPAGISAADMKPANWAAAPVGLNPLGGVGAMSAEMAANVAKLPSLPASVTAPKPPVTPVPATVPSQITSTGRSEPNMRGTRNIVVPGNPNQPGGGLATETDPREDMKQSFLKPGDPLLPQGSASGMVVAPQYRPADGDAVASVSYGAAPTARTGRIFDETGDVTGQIMDRVAGNSRPATPPVPSRSMEDLMTGLGGVSKAKPLSIGTGQPTSAQFGGVNVPPADWQRVPSPPSVANAPAPAAQPPAPARQTAFERATSNAPNVALGPNDQTLPKAGQPLRTKSAVDALVKGNLTEMAGHMNNYAAEKRQGLAQRIYNGTRGTAFEGTPGDRALAKVAGVQPPKPQPPIAPPAPNATPADRMAWLRAPVTPGAQPPKPAYDPIEAMLTRLGPANPKKKATALTGSGMVAKAKQIAY